MERYKAVEREAKTKAYSKEGLSSQSGKVDPSKKAKNNTRKWLSECLSNLNMQIDMCESETESLNSGKKKKGNAQRISELSDIIDKHNWHVGKLEIILRKLDNDELSPEDVGNIKDDLEYYIESNQDPDFAENEYLYDDLDLEEQEDDHSSIAVSEHRASKERIDEDIPPVTKSGRSESFNSLTSNRSSQGSQQGSQSSLMKSNTSLNSKGDVNDDAEKRKPAKSTDVDRAAKQKQTTIGTKYSTLASGSPKQGSIPSSPSAPAPRPPRAAGPLPAYAAAAAANTSVNVPSAAPATTTFQTSSHNPNAVSAPPHRTIPPSAASDASKAPGSAPLGSYSSRTISQNENIDQSKNAVGREMKNRPGPPGSDFSSLIYSEKAKDPNNVRNQGIVSMPQGTSVDERLITLQVLENSYRSMPEVVDEKSSKTYAPRNPCMTPPYYPQAPFSLVENPSVIENFEVDTLFFIFYYQQGTYQQYLAARELKNQSWRFHKKYSTWFQRHEEPKAITDEYEQGTYVYFDYETGWCQRKKTEFSFEYRYLEDQELA